MAQSRRRSGADFFKVWSKGIDVSLNDNPIFLTQKRLAHRSGMLVAILIAALVGLSLLSGLVAYLAVPKDFNFLSPQDAGMTFYGWIIGVEILVLVIGGCAHISQSLTNERKAGLWDSNRLTPLKSWQLVVGYWFGPPIREFYMGAVLGGVGLVIVLLARLPITLWLGSQILILSTAMFLGLISLLVGAVAEKPQNGSAFLILFIVMQLPSVSMSHFLLTNLLLPTYGLVNLFLKSRDSESDNLTTDWGQDPEIFGIHFNPVLLTLILQFLVGIFLWRAAVRKMANPFQPLMPRWEAVALFTIFLFVQHGLIWGVWQGSFPWAIRNSDEDQLLSIVQFITLILAMLILSALSPPSERIRIKAMRLQTKRTDIVISTSAVPLAIILAGIATIILVSQFIFSIRNSWDIILIAVGNIFTFFLIFTLLIESCRLRFKRRALGFIALMVFILCLLPYILAGVFHSGLIAECSLLSPGIVALNGSRDYDSNHLLVIVGCHFAITLLLFFVWRREWLKLLAKASTDQK
jgi:hypothetical protein